MQNPDTKKGLYYVTVKKDNGDFRFLLGPYLNDHKAALAAVPAAQKMAIEIDPRGHWYAYGTARVDLPAQGVPTELGILNKYFDVELQKPIKEAA